METTEITKYIVVSVLIVLLDVVWIGSNMSMYTDAVKAVQKSDIIVNYYYAFMAYFFVLFASLYIAIPFTKLHLEKSDTIWDKLLKSFLYGGTVGLAVNGLYNTTCLAIYKDYSASVALYDIIWATTLHTTCVFIYTLM
jgi:uncharacterized membrane protein